MTTVDEAKDAINSLDGALLDNRKITVAEAREQKPVKTISGRETPAAKRVRPPKGIRK
jgi:hypothetical protein